MQPHDTTSATTKTCPDCNKIINITAQRCRSCWNYWRKQQGLYDSPERNAKISAAVKRARANGAYDGIFTEEVRQKLSEASKEKWRRGVFTEDSKRRALEAYKLTLVRQGGFSVERRQRQSEAIRQHHAEGLYKQAKVVRCQREGSVRAQSESARRRQNAEETKRQWLMGTYDKVFDSPTSIEVAVNDALDEMQLSHQSQYRPAGTRFVFDEYVPPFTVIEVNGTYWHADPRLYADNKSLNHVQRAGRKRDARKQLWAKQRGYELFIVWEEDIRKLGALEALRVVGFKKGEGR